MLVLLELKCLRLKSMVVKSTPFFTDYWWWTAQKLGTYHLCSCYCDTGPHSEFSDIILGDMLCDIHSCWSCGFNVLAWAYHWDFYVYHDTALCRSGCWLRGSRRKWVHTSSGNQRWYLIWLHIEILNTTGLNIHMKIKARNFLTSWVQYHHLLRNELVT